MYSKTSKIVKDVYIIHTCQRVHVELESFDNISLSLRERGRVKPFFYKKLKILLHKSLPLWKGANTHRSCFLGISVLEISIKSMVR